MATDNKDDKTPTEDQNAGVDKAAGKAADKIAESSADSVTKSEPPVLSDTVSSTSVSASALSSASKSKAEAKSEPKPESKPEVKQKSKSKSKPESKSAASSPKTPSKKEKKPGSAIGWLALLISLVALAGVAYGLWTLQQDKQDKGAQQNRLDQSQTQLVDSFKASTQVLSSQVQGFIGKSDSQQQLISDLRAELQATARQIGEVTQVNRRSWMLAEAEYLLRLANQRLLMERETASALALLNSADQILVSVAEPGLFETREALARETAALRAVAHLDVEGVFVKLAALSEQVESLALLTPNTATDADEVVVEVAQDSEEGSVFSSALEHFNERVTIRHRDEPLAPLLTPEQHYYVQQNLRLMLEQAQLALLQRKPGVYTRSLDKAMSWVDEYFQLNETAQALLESLRELQPLQVDPELPDISASLSLLKAYLSNPSKGDQPASASIQFRVDDSEQAGSQVEPQPEQQVEQSVQQNAAGAAQ